MNLFANLNENQAQAVRQTEGPVLIIAGAGSGKTRVLVHRIAYILEQGLCSPSEIMAVTFTNKAAKELKERLIKLVGEEAALIQAGTFHALCGRILRKYGNLLGFSPSFVIYDTDDKLKVIKNICNRLNLDPTLFAPKKIANLISSFKNKMIYPDSFKLDGGNYFNDKLGEIYGDYQTELLKSNALDFDDMLGMTILLFDKHEAIKTRYQNMIKYLLVDEYQDTNLVQELFIRHLTALYGNLCVVGDEDQSIYSWRGADINNILSFHKRYPKAVVVQLEENYRSTQNILNAANAVISHNQQRLGKNLYTQTEGGEKIRLFSSLYDTEEADKIARMISEWMNKDTPLSEIAVFYRTNAQSRLIEDVLRRYGYAYTVIGGLKFYDRQEIKDVLAYLKLLVNPLDNVAWERVINTPARGVGAAAVKKIKDYAFENNVSCFDAIKNKEQIDGLSPQAKKGIAKFLNLFASAAELATTDDAYKVTEYFLAESGLKEHYTEEDAKADTDKAANLEEFLLSIAQYLESDPELTLIDYMESVALMTDLDTYNSNDERITLMTIHAAKGLEFDCVAIAGMNDGLFPSIRENNPSDMEEERRLFYVAVTRAKKELMISYYKTRSKFWGESNDYPPSRFLKALPEEVIDRREYRLFDENSSRSSAPRTGSYYGGKKKETTFILGFLKGEWVTSKQFGDGKVQSIEGEGEKAVVLVDFEDHGLKKLLAKYANLKKLDF